MDQVTRWPPPQSFQADEPLTVTLTAQEWNAVLAGLAEMPLRIARPVFDRITQQLVHPPGSDGA